MVVFETPRDLSLGLLADLLIAWAEGEMSEGFVQDVTGIDGLTLRGLKLAAIDRANAHAERHLSSRAVPTTAPPSSSTSGAASAAGS
jgi:hypothetical protein